MTTSADKRCPAGSEVLFDPKGRSALSMLIFDGFILEEVYLCTMFGKLMMAEEFIMTYLCAMLTFIICGSIAMLEYVSGDEYLSSLPSGSPSLSRSACYRACMKETLQAKSVTLRGKFSGTKRETRCICSPSRKDVLPSDECHC